jgi:hypothetical protein
VELIVLILIDIWPLDASLFDGLVTQKLHDREVSSVQSVYVSYGLPRVGQQQSVVKCRNSADRLRSGLGKHTSDMGAQYSRPGPFYTKSALAFKGDANEGVSP